MKRALFLLALVWALPADARSLTPVTPESVGLSSERLALIGTTLQAGVDADEIPGAVVLVARRGGIAYYEAFGYRDKATGDAMRKDTIFRIYSMTKPIVSVAAMTLHEEAKLYLSQPISVHLPAFKGMRVGPHFEPAARAITVQDLLRHTSGLTYAFIGSGAIKNLYKQAGMAEFELDMSIAEYAERLAELPLLYQPGTVWDYGRSTDVLGALIEAVSGTTLDAYMRERVLVPLGMSDSGFWVPESERHRVAEPLSDTLIDITAPPAMLAGGHGIVSTVMDYARFCQMMLEEGSLDGVRILGSETVAYMTADHLGDINRDGTVYLPGPGYGFGLGFAVRTHAGRSRWPGSVGEYFWGGYAGTYFWVDPTKEMIVVYMMQSVKQRGHYRMILRNLVNQAIMD
ncbi:MAG: serine hydrolase domain-containing protein [Alphaproteobacteria bacterium]|jgi:CubicO group peptidase (beta-lactamase class C family)|nr:serine hydrolase domain-containing protein [Alphaproteobacteria bacterium]MDP6238008.1 serine hydrolase domain-containing protein [Alphaproteobacteria bacterium]MDP7173634.1 serine hydrolase domain-containing protein [Alphaproteobacteria bacterium]MDP7234392.1 serine hydrolase domain-containing protein [Alphaproteobacteria bacterium]MDP7487153.1 serine hydrolase domain-containing protein [Alphaproteobacteria bacterium]|tara:strand:- start:1568 stop:2770 length:1203 start_codon:yes stop_codon:yes gene_type:complete